MKKPSNGRQRLTLYAIPTLALILVAAFCWPGNEVESDALEKNSPTLLSAIVKERATDLRVWESIDCGLARSCDPFNSGVKPNSKVIAKDVGEVRPVGTNQSQKTYSVQAILHHPDGDLALVDGSLVRVGDRLHSGRVLRISESKLIVEYD